MELSQMLCCRVKKELINSQSHKLTNSQAHKLTKSQAYKLISSQTHKLIKSQSISLPSPLGEGLGVRLHKAYHSPLPLERGWGVRPRGVGTDAFYSR